MENTALNKWPAPGKLNLFLHITGRRSNGYHNLQTVFQFFDYGDALSFKLRTDGKIRRINTVDGISASQDLVVRAANLIQSVSQSQVGVDIELHKNLPIGGGLGGGSSDAATTLLALNYLWNINMKSDALSRLGLQLGADVPIFVNGHAAWAEGVGEQLTPIDLIEPWYVIITPAVSVLTAKIFSDSELTRNATPIKIRDFQLRQKAGEIYGNNFEPVVRRHYPAVGHALDWMAEFAIPQLSGSGASVFAAFENEEHAREVAMQADITWQVIVAKGNNVSPLHRHIDKLYANK